MYTSKFPTQLCSYSSLSNFQYHKVYNGITRSKSEGIRRYLNSESCNQRCYCTAKTLVYFQEYYNEKIKQPRKVPLSLSLKNQKEWKVKEKNVDPVPSTVSTIDRLAISHSIRRGWSKAQAERKRKRRSFVERCRSRPRSVNGRSSLRSRD